MPNNKNFLVIVQEEFVGSVGALTRADGDFGGEGYIELDFTRGVIVAQVESDTKEDAIQIVTDRGNFSSDVLSAYELA